MILVSASGLGRQYQGDPVFSDVRFEIRPGDRVGLVGPNGAGKSTLVRLIAGLDRPDYGSLNIRPGIRIGYLRQQPDFDRGETLREAARSALGTLLELQEKVAEAAAELAEAETDDERARASRRYDELNDQLAHQDAYTLDHRVEEVLQGLGFSPIDFDREARTFSGGQQSRLMLARLLLQNPDLMLLDEPSNHLDIATTTWLENYLARQTAAMVVVSHDRYFLDKVVTRIWELHEGRVTAYPGNYTQYWRLREERAKVLERTAEKQEERVADLRDYISRNSVGQRARQAQDRVKKLARIERVETMRMIEGPRMGFDEVERSGDVAIEARNLGKSYDRPLFRKFNLAVHRGQCVAIMGPNGAGKSTLLKTLIGRVKPDEGEARLGHKVRIGYYDQGLEELPAETPLVRAVWPENDPSWVESDVRDLLGRFGLSGDVAARPVGSLSGGEKGKAALARLAATGANVLVMDEPTNHLDIWSCQALERSIREFEGTVLVVSHDRYFLNQVADRLVVVDGGRAEVVEGDYDTYRRLVKAREEEAAAREARAAAARAASNSNANSNAAAKSAGNGEKPRRKRRFPYRAAALIEADIGVAEAELADVETRLGDPETYRRPEVFRDLRARHDALRQRLEQMYEHLEEALELN